jgi:hypothetical protein
MLAVSLGGLLPVTLVAAAPPTPPTDSAAVPVAPTEFESEPQPAKRFVDEGAKLSLLPPSGWRRGPDAALNPPGEPVFEIVRFQLRVGDPSLYAQPVPLTGGLVLDAKAVLSIGLARAESDIVSLTLATKAERAEAEHKRRTGYRRRGGDALAADVRLADYVGELDWPARDGRPAIEGSGWLQRMQHYHGIDERVPQLNYRANEAPWTYLERGNLYVSCEVEEPMLPQVLAQLGDGCVIYASDIPHADREPFSVRALRARADLAEAAKQKILWENPRRLYGLS